MDAGVRDADNNQRFTTSPISLFYRIHSNYSNSPLQRPSTTTTRTEGTATTNGNLPTISSTARQIITNTTRSPTLSTNNLQLHPLQSQSLQPL
ncbi:hypothetical protein DPMN_193438 [Dreissena polymorpha]|uniref:Uncharacterized protein n=1 Tax=Dreissena polymorpha TaxID=45954 RepID=A0A9D3Y012_DREPO|nr:hypothetical protein DPMN_193438 [Dreissena polymorpha]